MFNLQHASGRTLNHKVCPAGSWTPQFISDSLHEAGRKHTKRFSSYNLIQSLLQLAQKTNSATVCHLCCVWQVLKTARKAVAALLQGALASLSQVPHTMKHRHDLSGCMCGCGIG